MLERRSGSRGKRTEYRLTRAGRELQPIIDLFGEWGARWAFGPPRANELDPIILLWWMRRRVAFERIARPRLLIQFDFRGTPQKSYWLLIDRNDVSVCLKHPGFDVDVIIAADITAFYQIWLGRSSLLEAARKGQVRLDGTPADLRALPGWFTWSPMAAAVRATVGERRTTAPRAMPSKRPSPKPAAARLARSH